MALLELENLNVAFPTRFGTHVAVADYSLHLERGEIHGLVGESGAGKSTIGAAVLGLLPGSGNITSGSIKLNDKQLVGLDANDWHGLRGKRVSMIFQDPQTSLNPLLSVEDQLVETICCHLPLSEAEGKARALELMKEVGIRDAKTRISDYPHQFSGGMRQRVVIALALASEPDIIVADEPTTALDVSVQKQILALIKKLAKDRGVGILLITHDMGVIAEITDTVSVLRHGACVEAGPTNDVLGTPTQPYTRALVASVPRMDQRIPRFPELQSASSKKPEDDWAIDGAGATYAATWLLSGSEQDPDPEETIIAVDDLSVVFASRPSFFQKRVEFRAANKVSFRIGRGETLGLVGESGSGKSTVAKAIVGINPTRAGDVSFLQRKLELAHKRPTDDPSRRQIQMIFQDPYSSLNNRWRVEDIISEPIKFYGLASGEDETRRIVASMLALVGLPQSAMLKYPHQFSGGQRQRIAIARALVARPTLLICDEPTSALDVSVQAQVLNLFKDIQSKFGLSILFISHDLPVVRQMSDTIVVMRNGNVIESGPSEAFFKNPSHEYSQQLMSEMPSLELLARPEALVAG